MNKTVLRTVLAAILCFSLTIVAFTGIASAAAFGDPEIERRLETLEDGETMNIAVWLNARYLVPDFDYDTLDKGYREAHGYVATPGGAESDYENDPLEIFCTMACQRAIPIIGQYMDIRLTYGEKELEIETWGMPVLEGKATHEGILKLMELPEVETIYFRSATASPCENEVLAGDADGNGRVTAADARLALRVSAKLAEVNAVSLWLIDLDDDGKVTAAEARKILRASAKLETL